jgi:hypothetical protein
MTGESDAAWPFVSSFLTEQLGSPLPTAEAEMVVYQSLPHPKRGSVIGMGC